MSESDNRIPTGDSTPEQAGGIVRIDLDRIVYPRFVSLVGCMAVEQTNAESAHVDILDDVVQEKPAQNLERFADLPNRRKALRARDARGRVVYLSHSIAHKCYRCAVCRELIPIDSENVLVNNVQINNTFTHHHVDFACAQDKIIPTLNEIKTVSPQEASPPSVNKKRRRLRYRNRTNQDSH